jgi:hypothetical protein
MNTDQEIGYLRVAARLSARTTLKRAATNLIHAGF